MSEKNECSTLYFVQDTKRAQDGFVSWLGFESEDRGGPCYTTLKKAWRTGQRIKAQLIQLGLAE